MHRLNGKCIQNICCETKRNEITRRRKKDIKVRLREIGYDCMDWINLVQDTVQRRDFSHKTMNISRSLRVRESLEQLIKYEFFESSSPFSLLVGI
jgi:hypothetical protein